MKNDFIKIIDGGLCAVKGVEVGGLKKGKYGLGIIKSENSTVAGLFTSNKVKAAPVLYTKNIIKNGEISGIVANSGNANCFTGEEGVLDCQKMVEIASKQLNIDKNQIAIASTGVIGRKMPMDVISNLIIETSKIIKNSLQASVDVAKAIMTTDTVYKEFSIEVKLLNGEKVRIGAVAKGSGMIAPNMATMLCFITTDVIASKEDLKESLKIATDLSFNMVVVDGDESTNDTILLMANGKSNSQLKDENSVIDSNFQEGLNFVCQNLAKMMAKDGEGATKFLEVEVINAKTLDDAKSVAISVVKSPLVKTAVFGDDPNWGRIVSAAGYSGADFNPDIITIAFESENKISYLVKDGKILGFDGTSNLKLAKEIMDQKNIKIIIDLNIGEFNAISYGCDFSYDYVKINAKYTT
ncbi:MAG: bifunctional ornithine acetyltransferase/N-acetylglutamate synthase [Methanobrevibacter sp.]|jgi:glutamate N-acetyltransferase/amino-acid N-acetyltransferase|nr:bifunctional ornithine acetyltransferase/N-acetylglutamate synthase [Candidatus Methanoflexus mossambicus]